MVPLWGLFFLRSNFAFLSSFLLEASSQCLYATKFDPLCISAVFISNGVPKMNTYYFCLLKKIIPLTNLSEVYIIDNIKCFFHCISFAMVTRGLL